MTGQTPETFSSELWATIRRIDIRTRHLVNESFAGEYHAVFKGRGMEFDEVREYQPGDEVRAIDWNVTARMGHPFIKRYIEERELTVMLVFDASASGDFGTASRFKREVAAEIGAVLAYSAISNNDKVGLLIFTDKVELRIPPRKTRRHVLRVIRELLAHQPERRGTDIVDALDALSRTLKRRAIVFLISDLVLNGSERGRALDRALLVTNRRHDLVAVTVSDRRELRWPSGGLVAMQDAETGRRRWVDTSSRAWRSAFHQRAEQRRAARRAMLRRAQVDSIEVMAGNDYAPALLSFFETRARRWRR